MRLFNQLVFDQVVIADAGNNAVVSSAEFNALLGKAYDLVLEIEIEQYTGVTQKVTLRYLESNSQKGFVALPDLITAATLGTLPYRNVKRVSGPLAAFGQVAVVLNATGDSARVRIWATGWSK